MTLWPWGVPALQEEPARLVGNSGIKPDDRVFLPLGGSRGGSTDQERAAQLTLDLANLAGFDLL